MAVWQIALIGMAGAAIPEAMRVVTLLRENGRLPNRYEWTASVILTLLGAGVLLFNTSNDAVLELAVLGASFPQLFSGLVATASAGRGDTPGLRGDGAGRRWVRDVVNYVSWRRGPKVATSGR